MAPRPLNKERSNVHRFSPARTLPPIPRPNPTGPRRPVRFDSVQQKSNTDEIPTNEDGEAFFVE